MTTEPQEPLDLLGALERSFAALGRSVERHRPVETSPGGVGFIRTEAVKDLPDAPEGKRQEWSVAQEPSAQEPVDPRVETLAWKYGSDEIGVWEAKIHLAGLDAADFTAGVVRVDTTDPAVVERVARVIREGEAGYQKYDNVARAVLKALAADD